MNELRRVMNYVVGEYDITWAEAVGCLFLALHGIASTVVNGETEDTEKPDA